MQAVSKKLNTYQARLGFDDADLRKPDHDEIMLWLDRNHKQVLKQLGVEPLGSKGIWEKPLKNGNFAVGFIDYMVTYFQPSQEPPVKVSWRNGGNLPKGVAPLIDTDKEFFITYSDLFYKQRNYYFEVKTAIPSIGELIRQIQFYKSYLLIHHSDVKFAVVCPDDRFQDVLRSQEIEFVLPFASAQTTV